MHEPEPEPESCGESLPPEREELAAEIDRVLREREAKGRPPLPEGAAALLALHAERVGLANEVMNLTRIVEPREVAVKHVLDSVIVADHVDLRGARVLDVGTGAGYPGIPLAVAVPSAVFALIDGTEKKAAFVDGVLEELGLRNAAALHTRAEVHLLDHEYDYLVARAVGPLGKLLPLLLPRRARFRALIALKGPGAAEEWDAARRAGATRGFELAAHLEEDLPDGAGKRAILVIVPTGARRMAPLRSGREAQRAGKKPPAAR